MIGSSVPWLDSPYITFNSVSAGAVSRGSAYAAVNMVEIVRLVNEGNSAISHITLGRDPQGILRLRTPRMDG